MNAFDRNCSLIDAIYVAAVEALRQEDLDIEDSLRANGIVAAWIEEKGTWGDDDDAEDLDEMRAREVEVAVAGYEMRAKTARRRFCEGMEIISNCI